MSELGEKPPDPPQNFPRGWRGSAPGCGRPWKAGLGEAWPGLSSTRRPRRREFREREEDEEGVRGANTPRRAATPPRPPALAAPGSNSP